MFEQEQRCSENIFSSPGIGLCSSNDVQSRTDHSETASGGSKGSNSGLMTKNGEHATSKMDSVDHETSMINNVDHMSSAVKNVYHESSAVKTVDNEISTLNIVDQETSTMINIDHESSIMKNVDHETSIMNNVHHETSTMNNVNHATSTMNNVNHATSTMNNVDHATSTMKNIDHATSKMNNVDHSTSTINNVDPVTSTMNNVNHATSTVNNIGHATANYSSNVHSADHTTTDNRSAVANADHATADSTSTTKSRSRISKDEREVLEREFLRYGFPPLWKLKEIAFSIQKKELQVMEWFERRIKRRNEERRDVKSSRRVRSPLHEKKVKSSAKRRKYSTHVDQWTPKVIPNWIHPRSELNPQLSLGNQQFFNPRLGPTQGQEHQVRIRGQPFIPNYYREINSYRVPQQPLPDDKQAIEDHYHSSVNQSDTRLVSARGQEVVNSDMPIPRPEHQVRIRGQQFIPNSYKVQQQFLLDDKQASEDRCHSPVNQRATMRCPSTGQEVEIKDILNHCKEIDLDEDRAPRQQQLLEEQQAGRDRILTPVNQELGTSRSVPTPGVGIKVRDHPFMSNFYRAVNDRGDGFSRQQPHPYGLQIARNRYHFPANLGTGTFTRYPDVIHGVHWGTPINPLHHLRQLVNFLPATVWPQWYLPPSE